MKQLFFFIFCFLCYTTLFAQDIIVKKDGSTISSKVLEINQNEIKYKKFNNLNGPTYSISKKDILSINYENGEREIFFEDSQVKHASEYPQLVNKSADEYNEKIVALYNNECHSSGKWNNSDEPAMCGYLVYWVSPSSVMSNDEIQMTFVGDKQTEYDIMIKNKTSNFIFVDLSKCYRICSTGDSLVYFSAEKNEILNKVSSANSTVFQQHIISIPPYEQRYITDLLRKSGLAVQGYEDFSAIKTSDLKGLAHAGETQFNEANSPFTIDYYLTYSTKENFSTYSILHAKLFLKTTIGSKYSWKHIKMAGWNNNGYTKIWKYIKGVKYNTLLGVKDYITQ